MTIIWDPDIAHTTIELLPTTVRKVQDPVTASVEAAKTQRAAELGARTGLYRAPNVVSLDGGTLVLERLHEITPLHAVLRSGSVVLEGVAKALAAVHRQLVLPDEYRTEIDSEHPGTKVWVHGDFSRVNVFVNAQGQLVILDWSTAPWLPTGTLALPWLDLSVFCLSLHSAAHTPRTMNEANRQAGRFLRAYAEHARLDDRAFKSYLTQLTPTYLKQVVRRRGRGWKGWAATPGFALAASRIGGIADPRSQK